MKPVRRTPPQQAANKARLADWRPRVRKGQRRRREGVGRRYPPVSPKTIPRPPLNPAKRAPGPDEQVTASPAPHTRPKQETERITAAPENVTAPGSIGTVIWAATAVTAAMSATRVIVAAFKLVSLSPPSNVCSSL